MKLNIGCGTEKREGFINIDINPDVYPDKIVNIEKGLPFKNRSIDYILCLQILEHVRNLDFVMSEIHRVSNLHTKIIIEVPYYNSKIAFTHPDHKRFFTEHTFQHYRDLFKVIKVKKQRGKFIPWHVHGLSFTLIKR